MSDTEPRVLLSVCTHCDPAIIATPAIRDWAASLDAIPDDLLGIRIIVGEDGAPQAQFKVTARYDCGEHYAAAGDVEGFEVRVFGRPMAWPPPDELLAAAGIQPGERG